MANFLFRFFVVPAQWCAGACTLLKVHKISFPFPESMARLPIMYHPHQRQLPTVKTIDYLQAIRLQSYIKENLSDDVLYHHHGSIRECPRANFFIVKGNKVITPKTDILWGITRSKILGLKLEGITLSEQDFNLSDLLTADEAFISSSTKNAFPILAIDGKKIGDGNPGEITRKINEHLYQLIGIS